MVATNSSMLPIGTKAEYFSLEDVRSKNIFRQKNSDTNTKSSINNDRVAQIYINVGDFYQYLSDFNDSQTIQQRYQMAIKSAKMPLFGKNLSFD